MPAPYQDPPGFGGGGGGGQMRFAMPGLTPVVKHLLLINVVVFLVTFALSFSARAKLLTFQALGLDPNLWADWFPFVPVWQLFTSGFLHDLNGLSHLLFNMLGLYFFGTMLEGLVGSRRFLVTYLAALLAGSVLHLAVEFTTGPFDLFGGPGYHRAAGASGAVLGVIVAMAVLRPHTQVIFILFPVKLMWIAIFIVAGDAFAILVNLRDSAGGDGVAHWVHLGGAAYGGLAAWKGLVWIDPIARWEAKRAVATEVRRHKDELQVDELLVKIQKEGINALTRREKEFLKKASQRNR